MRWYREHGYQFVIITDHEFLTDVAPLQALFGADGKFLVMPGQEVTQELADDKHPDGRRQAHVNALGSNRIVMPMTGTKGPPGIRDVTMSESYVRNVSEIRAAGAIAQINHPNWRWSVKPEDLAEISGPFLLEVWNGHPSVNNLGGFDTMGQVRPSAEAFWDSVLSQGKIAWAAGTDDSHDYLRLDDFSSERPGRAWVSVRASTLSVAAIMEALEKGQFYASNGVVLDDYATDTTSIAITIRQPRFPNRWRDRVIDFPDDRGFTTRFIGKGGRVLAEVGGLKPSYKIRGDEGYVRASIVDSSGLRAWTQPVFLDGRKTVLK